MKDDKDLFEDVPYKEEDLFEDVPYSEPASRGMLESAALGALEQGTLGFGDELGGLVQEPVGAIKKAASYVTGAAPDSDVQAYELAKQNTQQAMDEAYDQNPVSYGAGAIGSMLIPGAQLKGASIATKLAASAGAGAVSAVGESDENLLKEAATGAVSGGLTGGALLGAGNLAGKAGTAIKNKIASTTDKISDEYRRGSLAKVIQKFSEGKANEATYGESVADDLGSKLNTQANKLMSDFKDAFDKTGTQIGNIVKKYSNLPTKFDTNLLKSKIVSLKNEIIDNADKTQLTNIEKNLATRLDGTLGGVESARKYLANDVKTASPGVIQSIKSLKNDLDSEASNLIKSYNSEDFANLQTSRAKYRALADVESEIFGKRGVRNGLDEDITKAQEKAIRYIEKTFTPDVAGKTKTLRIVEKLGAVPEGNEILKTIKSSEAISKKLRSGFESSSGDIGKADPKNILSDNIEKGAFVIGKVSNYTPDKWINMVNNMPEGYAKKVLAPLANGSSTYKSAALFSLTQNPATRDFIKDLIPGETNE